MSEMLLSFLISFAILAGLAAWVPTLHFCHGCLKRMVRRRVSVEPSVEPLVDPILEPLGPATSGLEVA